jgi:pantothenate kinase
MKCVCEQGGNRVGAMLQCCSAVSCVGRVGGGTFGGLCRLLTGLRDFDEMLQLSMQGNNANVSVFGGFFWACVLECVGEESVWVRHEGCHVSPSIHYCQYSQVSGSSVGGGTFWGLCRCLLLTGLRDFDEMLQLSMMNLPPPLHLHLIHNCPC